MMLTYSSKYMFEIGLAGNKQAFQLTVILKKTWSGCMDATHLLFSYVFCCLVIVMSSQVIQVICFIPLKWTGMTCSQRCVCVLDWTVPSKWNNSNCSDVYDFIQLRVLCVLFWCPFRFLINLCACCCFADICKKPGECGQMRTLPGRSQQQRTVLGPVRYRGRERRQTRL